MSVVLVLLVITASILTERQETRLQPPIPFVPRFFVAFQLAPERRLGNAMFTFASAVGIAVHNNMTLIVDRFSPLVNTFRITELTVDNGLRTSSVVQYYEHERRASTYDAATRNLLKSVGRTQLPSNVRLCCYFQSWRYFDEVADRIRQNFRFQEPIAAAADAFFASKSERRNTTRVGVHVRRGDMVNGYSRGYTVAPPNYFRSAMRYFTERYHHVEFIVCSDDITWSQNNLPAAIDAASTAEIKFSHTNSPAVDLAILARCEHVIMSVGTFGWWGAWLANGTTIYYADWPRPSSWLDSQVNKSDYFPPHWIPMR